MDEEQHVDLESIARDAESPSVVNVPLDWQIPAGLMSRYATNFLVQTTENEVVISFFEAHPPILFERPKEFAPVSAECVARIIIAPSRLPELIRVLEEIRQGQLRVSAAREKEGK